MIPKFRECTEAVFQSLIGVERVEQGYVASIYEDDTFSEAVIVHFDPEEINLKTLIEIHLHTHKSTLNHSLRKRYRSAVYYFSEKQEHLVPVYLKELQKGFEKAIITKALPLSAFKPSRKSLHNYYQTNPERPFCKRFVAPKIKMLLQSFSKNMRAVGIWQFGNYKANLKRSSSIFRYIKCNYSLGKFRKYKNVYSRPEKRGIFEY